jgi:L-2-hydroxyglutarate oxidase
MVPGRCDVVIVGGGIVGLATARALHRRHPDRKLVVLERENRIASHQTSHNSGVIHAGIYYRAGSLKARLCTEGARELYAFCEERGIPNERCGKVIVARDQREVARLDELEHRGRENNVPGLERLSAAQLQEVEPHCRGRAALLSPATGIVDFAAVARAYAEELRRAGVPVVTSCPVDRVALRSRHLILEHGKGRTEARFAVFCAGAWSDRLAVRAGADADPRIVPFRGAYLHLRPERRHLVRALIYPVPDPTLPFLGVHLSRHVDGSVSLGPTALLSVSRGDRGLRGVGPDLASTLAWPGTWRMARRWWRTGLAEIRHSVSRRSLADAAAEYVPEIRPDDFADGFVGIRAQALTREGGLVDDFVVSDTERALHVRNAPSPAATASLALGRLIANRVEERMA